MSYNLLAHGEDAASESNPSDIRASPVKQKPTDTMSPDLDLHSLPPEVWTRPRTVSRDGSGPMQCPTPNLQSIQGAYRNNVERLEQSAERLSLSSDIGEAIRQIREEQKNSDSRSSSVFNASPEGFPDRPSLHRQLSCGYGSHASNSVVGTNSIARSGGFSPAGYVASPRGSVRSSRRNSFRGRSTSQGPRLEQVAEPQQEGKPLDSPMSTRFAPVHAEPQQEAKPLDSPMLTCVASTRQASAPSQGGLRIVDEEPYNLDDTHIPGTESPEPEVDELKPMMPDGEQEARPSTDTARQVSGLFSDFDGVHSVAQPMETPMDPSNTHRQSIQLLDERPQTFAESGPPEGMVYYPAPVPMMLNLPKKLSKQDPSAFRDKRRTQLIGNLSPDIRKSAAWLPGMSEGSEEHKRSSEDDRSSIEYKRRTTAKLPPQLRASMFFEYPATNQDVEVKGGSAVATLDSILDASAFAPVSAFTDHPIVGQAGADIYSRTPVKRSSQIPAELRNRNSSGNLLTKRTSRATLLDDSKKRNSLISIGTYFGRRKSSVPQLDEILATDTVDGGEAPMRRSSADYHEEVMGGFTEAQEDEGDVHSEDQERQPFGDQPTTLLAELQMRKNQQKLRMKTAATDFPDGMHSTLLQLDAVAQVQQKTRNQKRTLLAWEDPDAQQACETEDNDDVPLGVLYPTQKIRREQEDRPLGLIAKRHMEDHEPLSHRRARLHAEDPRASSLVQRDTLLAQEFPVFSDNNKLNPGEEDEETLAERLKRIKATRIRSQPSRVSGDFTYEIMSQLGGLEPGENPPPEPQKDRTEGGKSPESEGETLGQRRRRLQAEAAANTRNTSSNNNTNPPPEDISSPPKRHSMADILQAHPTAGGAVSNEIKYAPAPKSRNTSWAMHVNQQAANPESNARPKAGGPAPHTMVAGGKDLEETNTLKKDIMIDRWRQSVMY